MGSKKKNPFLTRLEMQYTMFFALFAIIFLGMLGKQSMISIYDGKDQYYPAMAYVGKYLRQYVGMVLHGNFSIPQFDFSIGFGEGVFPSLNYYGLGDPFLLLCLLIPASLTAYGYTVINLIKLYVAGLSYLFYCKKRGFQPVMILGTVFLYLFQTYAIYFGLLFPQFLNVLVTLPLICAGIDAVILGEKKLSARWGYSTLLIIAVGIQALTGFYCLYMELLFAGIYALIVLCQECRNGKEILTGIGVLMAHVILGMMLGGMFLVPSVWSYFASSRTGDTDLGIWKRILFLSKEQYWTMFSQLIVPAKWSEFSLGIPAIGFMAMMSLQKEKCDHWLRNLLLVVAVGYLFTGVTSWVSGGFTGGFYYNRWLFALGFVVSIGICAGGTQFLSQGSKTKWIQSGVAVVYLLLILIVGRMISACMVPEKQTEVMIGYLVWTILTLAPLFMQKIQKEWVISGILMVGVIIQLFCVFRVYDGKNMFFSYEKSRAEIANSTSQNFVTSSEWFRLDIPGEIREESLYMGYRGASEYLSLLNEHVIDFYDKYLISGEKRMQHCVTGLDARNPIESLLSVEYYEFPEDGQIKRNDNVLPFGVTFDKVISPDVFETWNPVERNLSALYGVVTDVDSYSGVTQVNHAKDLEWQELQVEIMDENVKRDGERIAVEKGSRIQLEFVLPEASEIYFYTDCLVGDGYERRLDICGNTYYLPWTRSMREWLSSAGIREAGKHILWIEFYDTETISLGDIHLYAIPTRVLEQLVAERRQQTLENIAFEKNHITGEITVEQEKLLFLQIPYGKGWSAEVNGEKTEIYRADYGFIAILLPKGYNEVTLCYKTPGLGVGMICSLISLMGLLILGIARNRGTHR